MKIVFDKQGKYKNGISTLVITRDDVTNGKIFDVDGENAESFVSVGKAHYPEKKGSPKKEDVLKIETKEDKRQVDNKKKDK